MRIPVSLKIRNPLRVLSHQRRHLVGRSKMVGCASQLLAEYVYFWRDFYLQILPKKRTLFYGKFSIFVNYSILVDPSSLNRYRGFTAGAKDIYENDNALCSSYSLFLVLPLIFFTLQEKNVLNVIDLIENSLTFEIILNAMVFF